MHTIPVIEMIPSADPCRTRRTTGALALILLLPLTARAQPAGDEGYEGKVIDGIELLAEVYRTILQGYAVEVDPMNLAEAGVRGMTGSLDDYTLYISPEENRRAFENNHRVDPGIDVKLVEERLTIVAVLPGSSAEQVGIRPGDRLLGVEGVAVDTLGVSDIIRLLDGEERKGVEITVERGAEGEEKRLTFRPLRERSDRPALRGATLLPDSILYIDLDYFADHVALGFRSELLRIGRYEGPPERIRGMILDLRGNTGGKLREGIDVADMLLPSGSGIVSLDSRNSEDRMEEFSEEREILPGVPLVILVDRRTASAAEVLAAALQDNRRGVIIGEGSYGKGLVQSIEQLSNDGFLHITSAWYRTPSGRSTQGRERYPVVPDSLLGIIGVRPDSTAATDPSAGEGYDLLWRLDTAHLFTLFASDEAAPHDELTPALLDDPTLFDRFLREVLEREPATAQMLRDLASLRERAGEGTSAEIWNALRQEILRTATERFNRHRTLITARLRQALINQYPTHPQHGHDYLQSDPLITQARHLLNT